MIINVFWSFVGACTDGAHQLLGIEDRKCYHFNTTEVSWTEARTICRARGGDLPSLSSINVYSEIVRLMVNANISAVHVGLRRHGLFVDIEYFWGNPFLAQSTSNQ